MNDFDYLAPTSLEEAVAALRDAPGGKVMAGGTDLLVQMRNRRFQPERVVDLKRVPDLGRIEMSGGLRLGAAVSCRDVYRNERIAAGYAGLIDVVTLIGGVQIQGRASIGGNLCNASPSADAIPMLIAYGAVCEIAGPAGTREVPVERFCSGPGVTVLLPDELLVAIRLPEPAPDSGAHYQRFIPRNEMDIAVVGVGAAVRLTPDRSGFEDARIALGAVGPTPLFVPEAGDVLRGREISDANIAEAAARAAAAARPISDMRGSAEYRRHLVGVLVRRVVHGAVRRARGEFVPNAIQELAHGE